MDENEIIENLWNSASTILAAVRDAYDAVGGEGTMPSSLVETLEYIAANAGGGDVPVGSSVVTDASLSSLASAVLNGDEGQTGQNLVDNVLMPTVTQIASILGNQSAINPSADWGNQTDLLGRAGFIATGLRTMEGEIPVSTPGGPVTIDLPAQYASVSAAQFKDWMENNGDADVTSLKNAFEVSIDKPIDDWTLGEFIPFVMYFFCLGMEAPTSWPPTATG